MPFQVSRLLAALPTNRISQMTTSRGPLRARRHTLRLVRLLVLIAGLLVAFHPCACAQSSPGAPFEAATITDMKLSTPDVGWVATHHHPLAKGLGGTQFAGSLFRTTDGGRQWEEITPHAGRRGRRRSAYEAPRAAADRGTRLGGAESKRRRRPRLPAPPSRVTLLDATCLLISLRLGKTGAPGRTRGSGCVKGRNRQLHSRELRPSSCSLDARRCGATRTASGPSRCWAVHWVAPAPVSVSLRAPTTPAPAAPLAPRWVAHSPGRSSAP